MNAYVDEADWYIKRDKCPVCHHLHATQLFSASLCDSTFQAYLSRYYHPTDLTQFEKLCEVPYQLDECHRCSTIFQRYILNDAMMGILYEDWISSEVSYNKYIKNTNPTQFAKYAQEIMTIRTLFNKPVSEIDVLDYGMGWGYWCRLAALVGFNVYGTELSKERLEYAAKHQINVLTLAEAQQRQFDFINTEQVFEHLPRPLDTLRELRAMLKPSGVIKISVPNGKFIPQLLKNPDWTLPFDDPHSLKAVTPLEHINCFQQRSIPIMAQEAGLDILRIPLRTRLANIVGLNPVEMARQVYRTFRPGTYRFLHRPS